MKTILALDLATRTGWAYRAADGTVSAGAWQLQEADETTKAAKLRRDRTLDMRIPTLYRLLKDFWQHFPESTRNYPVDFLVFEDVTFSTSTMQTQLWASLRAVVWLFCYNYGIARDCCPVGTLKKHASGFGTATKPVMIDAAKRLYPSIEIGFDDDKADALCLLDWACKLTERQSKG